MIEISLTQEEKDAVIAEANRRQSDNEQRKLKGRNGGAETGGLALRYHLLGAAGEMAVASYLGLKDSLYQEKQAVRDSCDLPFDIDVKTRSKHWYDLIVQLDDKPGKNYWLVTIENKKIMIQGWLPWDQCAKTEYVMTPNGRGKAYFIPQKHLYMPDSWFTGSKRRVESELL